MATNGLTLKAMQEQADERFAKLENMIAGLAQAAMPAAQQTAQPKPKAKAKPKQSAPATTLPKAFNVGLNEHGYMNTRMGYKRFIAFATREQWNAFKAAVDKAYADGTEWSIDD